MDEFIYARVYEWMDIQGARDLDHKSLTLYIFIPEYRRIKVKVLITRRA